VVEALFWPALVAYGEAMIAYASPRFARLGTWGVRLGWLAQTALLAVQATRADGFPWASWAGSLNLFVWLVVGTYLIWGCRPRFRLLGLSVMPLVFALFVVARVGGGTDTGHHSDYGNLFLVLHVGFVLAAFAGFTLAAGLAGLYLVEERRLKQRAADILRLRLPSLVTLESITMRTIAVSLPLLTLGLIAGFVRLRDRGGGVDALMGATIAAWAIYAALLGLRSEEPGQVGVNWEMALAASVARGGSEPVGARLVGLELGPGVAFADVLAPVELSEGELVTVRGASVFRNGDCVAAGRTLGSGPVGRRGCAHPSSLNWPSANTQIVRSAGDNSRPTLAFSAKARRYFRLRAQVARSTGGKGTCRRNHHGGLLQRACCGVPASARPDRRSMRSRIRIGRCTSTRR